MKFITTPDAFDQCILENGRETILIGGDLVYASIDRDELEEATTGLDEEGESEYIQQHPRSASKSRLLDRSRKHLYLAVKRSAAQNAVSYHGKVALIADHYLAYGLALKKNTILIGGAPISSGIVNLEVFVFTDTRLESVLENRWDSTPFQLESVLKNVLDKHPMHDIHWCSPLPPPPLCDVSAMERFRLVREEPFKRLVERRIQLRKQRNDESLGVVPALCVLGVSVAIYATSIGFGYSKLNSARSDFKSEISGFEDAYKNSAQSLEQLRFKQELMNDEPEHLRRLAMEDSFLAQVATLPNVLIKSVIFYSPKDLKVKSASQGSMDSVNMDLDQFRIELSLPKEDELSARDQAEPMVAMLNNKTGMTVRLIDHTDESIKVGTVQQPYWKYTLGGATNVSN